ncbi:PREDICTED: prohormone-1-like [Vollenhovia emeryi]|uniref:prohormone-1-like n=1 Tax=Vollenhovia emeryi TaxID=411798 RepID=UPI0005F3E514|nr:PREDICTED: prohormone-1-like [Vollenhovia emeryi]
MTSVRSAVTLTLMLLVLVEYSRTMPAIDKERFLDNVNLVNDDGNIEAALMNYIFSKQIVKSLRNQLNFSDLQHKRSSWKMCATNAVACFGK